MRCGDLGLFLSSFVLKRRKYFALIHMSYKLSMVKASIYFSFFFLFLFFFNLSPLLTWNDGQRISSPIMVFRSIVHKNRNIKKKIVCILAKRVKNLPKVIDQFPFDPK